MTLPRKDSAEKALVRDFLRGFIQWEPREREYVGDKYYCPYCRYNLVEHQHDENCIHVLANRASELVASWRKKGK